MMSPRPSGLSLTQKISNLIFYHSKDLTESRKGLMLYIAQTTLNDFQQSVLFLSFVCLTSMVSAILSVITPALRTRILAALPPELGLLMRTLPSPFSCRGEFDITGPELLVLSTPLEKSQLLCQMFEYSPSQMDMFQWLQKSMDRYFP